MAFDFLAYVADLEIPSAPKLVLFVLGNAACQFCGLAWPGKAFMMRKTGLKETRLTAALAELKDLDLIRVHRYSQGGRGRTTEYVVLHHAFELSTAPCGKCTLNLKTPRPARGIANAERETPRDATPFDDSMVKESTNPSRKRVKTPRHANPNQSVLTNQSSREREADPAAPGEPPDSAPLTPELKRLISETIDSL